MRRFPIVAAVALALAALAGCSSGVTPAQRDEVARWFYDSTTLYEAGGNDACEVYTTKPAERQSAIDAVAARLDGDKDMAAEIVDDEIRRRCEAPGH